MIQPRPEPGEPVATAPIPVAERIRLIRDSASRAPSFTAAMTLQRAE
jgi:hypothetical protein